MGNLGADFPGPEFQAIPDTPLRVPGGRRIDPTIRAPRWFPRAFLDFACRCGDGCERLVELGIGVLGGDEPAAHGVAVRRDAVALEGVAERRVAVAVLAGPRLGGGARLAIGARR